MRSFGKLDDELSCVIPASDRLLPAPTGDAVITQPLKGNVLNGLIRTLVVVVFKTVVKERTNCHIHHAVQV